MNDPCRAAGTADHCLGGCRANLDGARRLRSWHSRCPWPSGHLDPTGTCGEAALNVSHDWPVNWVSCWSAIVTLFWPPLFCSWVTNSTTFHYNFTINTVCSEKPVLRCYCCNLQVEIWPYRHLFWYFFQHHLSLEGFPRLFRERGPAPDSRNPVNLDNLDGRFNKGLRQTPSWSTLWFCTQGCNTVKFSSFHQQIEINLSSWYFSKVLA